jgi:CsoR family transcriptional regulator, copper-sensing transcriptional repressor
MIDTIKKRAIHRSRILQGQLQGLEKMIEKEEYCIDILTQSLAIQKSLASLDKLILENHLNTHVKVQLAGQGKKSADETVKELLNLYELHNVRGK